MTEPPTESTTGSPTEPAEPSPPRRWRILLKLFLSFCVFSFVVLGLLGWYVTTDSFHQWVRRRVIASAEKLTGGRVELGELHTRPFRLRVDVRNLTIHGDETPDQAPFLHVDGVQAEMKIISLLSTTVGLHSLALEHPVVHVIVYPDGSTNAPTPHFNRASSEGPVEELISLAVRHLAVQHGEILWEDKRVPVDFNAQDLKLVLNYSLLHRHYDAHLVAGSVTTHFEDYPSFVWRADASLLLMRGRADISSLTVTSGKSEFHFAGQLEDFRNPQVSGNYHGVADLGELAALTRQTQVRRGTAQFEGKGSWSLHDFATQGNLQAKDLDWSNRRLAVRNGRITTGFLLTPDRFHLSSIKASLLGGDLAGDADVTNWQSSLERSEERSRGQRSRGQHSGELSPALAGRLGIGKIPPRGSMHLQLAGFPLLPALEFLSSPKLPLDELNLSGRASGSVETVWVGSIRDAETRLKLAIAPPPNPAANEVPLRGQIDGDYSGSRDELELTQLQLTTPGSEITAAGNLSATSSLRFSFTSHNVKEWKPLLEAAYGSRDLPFTVHGWASFSGNASGTLSALSIAGNLEGYDFDTTLPATERAASRSVHWDALSSAIQYSSNHFAARNGLLIHGHTTTHFDASAALDGGTFPEGTPFTLHFDLRNGNVAEAARIAGVDQAIAGTLDMSATVSGTRANPHGDGRIELHDAAGYGVGIPLVTGDLHLSGGELQFNNIAASVYGAPISGSAAIATSGGGLSKNEFRVNLSGRNLDLARLPHFQSGRLMIDGIGDFTLRASGTLAQPSLDAHVHIKDIALDKERAGDFYLDAVTRGRELTLKAHSDFDKSDLTINGSVALEHDFPADLNLAFHHLDADSFLRIYLPGEITNHSPVDGTMHLSGPLLTPRDLKAQAELQSLSVEIEHVPVQSVGPIRFEVADQTVTIERFHVAGSGTDFTAHGRAQLSGDQDIEFRLDGTVNMALFQTFNPKILARGTLGVSLDADGTIRQPVLQGRLEVKSTFISHNDFPSGLSDLKGVLQFDRNRVQIEHLSGTTGGGNITLTGSAIYQGNSVFLLDFGATAEGVRLRYPPGVSSTANANVRLTGTTNGALLSGDVVVTKLAVTPGFDFAAYIEKSRQALVLTQTNSLQSHLKLDVHVVTTPELQMQTAIARLSGDADLRLRGTAERPVVLGRAEVLEGEIKFNGNTYHLERGDVTFANPAKTQPIIDLQATTRVRDYDITVQFRGDASAPNGLKVTWQSEPQLPEADVIALLALGRTQEESAAAAASGSSFGFGGEASNLLINEALNSTVNSRLQRLFGASRVKVDPQGLASETSVVRGPQVTVEQQVASNITLTYSTNVSVSNQQIIQVEYNITRTISIVALRDQNGVVSFDFKIRRRKK